MKTVVSIPDDLFNQAKAVAGRLGVSRSELYAKSIAEYGRHQEDSRVTEQLNQVYANQPAKTPSRTSPRSNEVCYEGRLVTRSARSSAGTFGGLFIQCQPHPHCGRGRDHNLNVSQLLILDRGFLVENAATLPRRVQGPSTKGCVWYSSFDRRSWAEGSSEIPSAQHRSLASERLPQPRTIRDSRRHERVPDRFGGPIHDPERRHIIAPRNPAPFIKHKAKLSAPRDRNQPPMRQLAIQHHISRPPRASRCSHREGHVPNRLGERAGRYGIEIEVRRVRPGRSAEQGC